MGKIKRTGVVFASDDSGAPLAITFLSVRFRARGRVARSNPRTTGMKREKEEDEKRVATLLWEYRA